jgi:hypothetical protein
MIYFAGRTYTNFFGGAEVLVINIVTELGLRGIPVGLIGNLENEAIKILNQQKKDFEFIDSSIEEINLSPDDIVIIFTYTSDLLKIRGNPKVFLWCILSLNLTQNNKIKLNLLFVNTFLKFITKMLYVKMNKKNSLSFMDKSSYLDVTSYFKIEIPPKYIPIPVESYGCISNCKYISNKQLTITYLGRGNEIWKIYSIVKVLEDINKINELEKITVYILTDSDILYKKLIPEYEKIAIHYVYGLKGKELHQFLCENSQLHFACGTSALEGSICKIPTILMDASYQLFPLNYKYKWIFETEGYSLGGFVERGAIQGFYTMLDLIKSISSKERYYEFAEKGYQYTINNHAICKTVDLLFQIRPKFDLKSYLFFCKPYWKFLILKK